MSEPDSFIDEVSEEVRRDRLYATFRRYAWIPALIVIGIVGGTIANEYVKSQTRSAAEQSGDAILRALESPTADEQPVEALAALSSQNPDQDVLVKLTLAARQADADKPDDAFETLKAAAASTEASAVYTDLARLKAAMLRPDDPWSAEAMSQIILSGGAYRLLALEQRGLIALEAGDREAALTDFNSVLEDPGLTEPMLRRVGQIVVALGGEIPSFTNLLNPDG